MAECLCKYCAVFGHDTHSQQSLVCGDGFTSGVGFSRHDDGDEDGVASKYASVEKLASFAPPRRSCLDNGLTD